jgi:opacity protein-like surface antigen
MTRQLLLATLLAATQDISFAQNYEITPFLGWRTSSSLEDNNTGDSIDLKETSSFGIILSMKQKRDSNYDFLFSRQDTELQSTSSTASPTALRFDYYHLGGTVFYDHDDLHPFISGGLGATHISPANDNFSSETKFSLSIGGGLKFPFSQNTGLRLEARGYGTVVDSDGSLLCANGVCVARFTGSLFIQFEAFAGFTVAF